MAVTTNANPNTKAGQLIGVGRYDCRFGVS